MHLTKIDRFYAKLQLAKLASNSIAVKLIMGPLVTKILCGVLVMSLSVLFGYLPVLISRKVPFLSASDPRNNKKALRNTVFSFVLNFGGGVLFANSFCHWLPEVREGKRVLWQQF